VTERLLLLLDGWQPAHSPEGDLSICWADYCGSLGPYQIWIRSAFGLKSLSLSVTLNAL
jgi:hypothetical protein